MNIHPPSPINVLVTALDLWYQTTFCITSKGSEKRSDFCLRESKSRMDGPPIFFGREAFDSKIFVSNRILYYAAVLEC